MIPGSAFIGQWDSWYRKSNVQNQNGPSSVGAGLVMRWTVCVLRLSTTIPK
jgi:hypothetical protein